MDESLRPFFDFLKSVTRFSLEDFEQSSSSFQLKSFKKGERWIEQGTICREVAFINRGVLRSYYIDQKGDDITWCFCVENTVTSSFKSFLSQQASELSIQALHTTELITIGYDELQVLQKTIPVWQEVNRILLEKEYMALAAYATSLNREGAREKYLRLLTEQPAVLQYASVQHIASYLGVTRETLSRIRKQISR